MTVATEQDKGLRARKKRETRHALHRAAIELLHEGNYCDVTIEAIASRAGVSPRTFFNYFPTKESALTGTDPDLVETARALMEARPPEEDIVTAIRAVTLIRLRRMVVDTDLWSMRRAVSRRHPELAASLVGANALADKAMAEVAAQRAGVDPDVDVTPMAVAYAALGAIRAALQQHVAVGFQGSVEERIDTALRAAGLRD